jgi:hypothetical protein
VGFCGELFVVVEHFDGAGGELVVFRGLRHGGLGYGVLSVNGDSPAVPGAAVQGGGLDAPVGVEVQDEFDIGFIGGARGEVTEQDVSKAFFAFYKSGVPAVQYDIHAFLVCAGGGKDNSFPTGRFGRKDREKRVICQMYANLWGAHALIIGNERRMSKEYR